MPWRAVIGGNSAIVVPGLPNGTRSYNDGLLSDAGAGRIGVRMINPSAAASYWALSQGTWLQYMKEGVTGSLGPGRTGATSAAGFLEFGIGGS